MEPVVIKLDLSRTVKALERIADLLELIVKPPPTNTVIHLSNIEDMFTIGSDEVSQQTDVERYGPRSNY